MLTLTLFSVSHQVTNWLETSIMRRAAADTRCIIGRWRILYKTARFINRLLEIPVRYRAARAWSLASAGPYQALTSGEYFRESPSMRQLDSRYVRQSSSSVSAAGSTAAQSTATTSTSAGFAAETFNPIGNTWYSEDEASQLQQSAWSAAHSIPMILCFSRPRECPLTWMLLMHMRKEHPSIWKMWIPNETNKCLISYKFAAMRAHVSTFIPELLFTSFRNSTFYLWNPFSEKFSNDTIISNIIFRVQIYHLNWRLFVISLQLFLLHLIRLFNWNY